MEQRPLGRTGASVSVIGLGTWQLGADWGDVDDTTARSVLDTALDAGVTLLDTADVYGDGRSEQRISAALARAACSVRPSAARSVACHATISASGPMRSSTRTDRRQKPQSPS